MQRAREVFKCYDALPGDIVVTVSSDGTWQRRGFSSLFGVTFIIEHETKKILDYEVMSKFCAACKTWADCDRESEEFKKWQEEHKSVCEANFTGSAGAMEPTGVLLMFSRSLSFNIRYKHLICDGDAKTHSLLLEESPYGEEHTIEKVDCVGHVQKRMGTALHDLKKKYRGQKLSDNKTIGAGRLTESVINSLQNYYGEAIRSHTESTGYDESCSSLTPTPMNNPVITCAQKVKHLGANGRKTRPKELNTPTRNHHYLLPSSNCYSLFTVA